VLHFGTAWVFSLPLTDNLIFVGSAWDIAILAHILQGKFTVDFASVGRSAARGFVIQNIGLQVVILAVSVALVLFNVQMGLGVDEIDSGFKSPIQSFYVKITKCTCFL
jgi:hypothetical protein